MTPPRPPALEIEGYEFERVLGSGGFADIYLYSQRMPRRRVAVKVMRAPVTEGSARAQFESEANLMAQLSSHPSIVTIHHAAVADNGRPYLVMEYCSRASLADRYQQRVLSVPEMLHTIIRLCGAVETAHLAGILHRDIKPANVLTTDYGWPALTDFGISVIAGEATIGAGGVSIPWAPPEAIGGPGVVDRRSDVYSLAATAYTVLAGHSPFDGAGTSADISQFMQRIMSAPVPPIGRSDVPAELERVIEMALAKNQEDRPQSAASFARSLQRIEHEMRLPVTHMDIPGGVSDDLDPRAADDDDIESTRIAGSDSPIGPPVSLTTPRPSADDEPDERTTVSARVVAPEPSIALVEAPPDAGHPQPVTPSAASDIPDGLDERTTVRRREADLDERTTVRARTPEVDESTTVRAREAELEERTTVRSRAEELDERTTVADRPHNDRTQVTQTPRAGVARPTAAGDVPGGNRRVAYIPSADPQRQKVSYGARHEPIQAPIWRAPASPPPAPSALPATEKQLQVSQRQGTRRGIGVIAIVVAASLVVAAVAVVGVILLVGSPL